MEITIDLDEVKAYIENPEFHRYLLDTAPSFEAAAFILQTLLDAVESAVNQVDNWLNICYNKNIFMKGDN